jgi:hypothetical protein
MPIVKNHDATALIIDFYLLITKICNYVNDIIIIKEIEKFDFLIE